MTAEESKVEDDTVPEEFLCELTKKIMRDPMVSRYGTHFERQAIMDHLNEGNNYCPVTGNGMLLWFCFGCDVMFVRCCHDHSHRLIVTYCVIDSYNLTIDYCLLLHFFYSTFTQPSVHRT